MNHALHLGDCGRSSAKHAIAICPAHAELLRADRGLLMLSRRLGFEPSLERRIFGDLFGAHPYARRNTGFKFFNARHRELILNQGSVKVGTLSAFREMEQEALRDWLDGTKSVHLDSLVIEDGKVIESPLPHRSNAAEMRNILQSFGRSKRVRVTRHTTVIAFDAYAYCFSFECSRRVLRSFDQTDSPECVAEITDLHGFANALIETHPQLRGWEYMLYPMVYRRRTREMWEPSPEVDELAFEKDWQFRRNCEGRIYFIPPDGLTMPAVYPPLTIVADINLTKFFREISMPQCSFPWPYKTHPSFDQRKELEHDRHGLAPSA